jgi:integrase
MYGSKSFYDFVDCLVIELQGKLTPGSLKGYKDQKNKMKSFKPVLLFKEIDRRFIDKYELFLIKVKENNKNTITKSMKFIKSVLNKAVLARMIKENVFDKIPLGRTDGNREFLTINELNILDELYYKNELKQNKNNVLKYFLFCCYTGLRYSDIKNLRFIDILDNKYLSVSMVKTKEKVTIPLIEKAKKLIPRQYFNNQKVFKVLADQPTNRYLKDIMKEAKINKSISFHCSRHTFATVSKTLGIEYDVISKILGHTDIKTTKVYTRYEVSHLEKEMEKWDKLI